MSFGFRGKAAAMGLDCPLRLGAALPYGFEVPSSSRVGSRRVRITKARSAALMALPLPAPAACCCPHASIEQRIDRRAVPAGPALLPVEVAEVVGRQPRGAVAERRVVDPGDRDDRP